MNLDRSSELLTRAAAGEERALTELYLGLRDQVLGLCRRLLRSTGEAEEAAAEVLLRLNRLARDYDGRIEFHRWVLRAASNHCIDLLRRRTVEQHWVRARALEWEATRVECINSPITLLIAEEDRAKLRAAIDKLSDPLRVALVLRYYEDLSYAEIAERMKIPIATVGTYLFRAKAELRSQLDSAVTE